MQTPFYKVDDVTLSADAILQGAIEAGAGGLSLINRVSARLYYIQLPGDDSPKQYHYTELLYALRAARKRIYKGRNYIFGIGKNMDKRPGIAKNVRVRIDGQIKSWLGLEKENPKEFVTLEVNRIMVKQAGEWVEVSSPRYITLKKKKLFIEFNRAQNSKN